MTHVSDERRPFAERLRAAVEETAAVDKAQRPHEPWRRRRLTKPSSAPVANPSRVRYSDELFVDRLRKALD